MSKRETRQTKRSQNSNTISSDNSPSLEKATKIAESLLSTDKDEGEVRLNFTEQNFNKKHIRDKDDRRKEFGID